MAGSGELSAGGFKRLGSGTVTMAMLLVLLVALTCISGVQRAAAAAEAASKKLPSRAGGAGTAKDVTLYSWRPKLRASFKAKGGPGGGGGRGGYDHGFITRVRSSSCQIHPQVCVNASVPGNACCGTTCLDLDSHPWHCGKCNHPCRPGRVCCSGKCKNVNRDKHNCGACKTRCATGFSCSFGLCGYN